MVVDIERPDLRRRKQRLFWGIVLVSIGLTIAALFGVARIGPALPAVDRNSIWIDAVRRGPMLRAVRGEGTLAPREIRWITAATGANVAHILVRPGAAVQASTVLMHLVSPELVAELDSARAAVAVARAENAARRMSQESQLLDLEASVAQLQSAQKLAEAKLQAGDQLMRTHAISTLVHREYQLNAEQQQTLLRLAQERVAKFRQTLGAQLNADRARQMQLEDAYALRRQQVGALEVKAGSSGVLQSVSVQEGAQVAAGTNLARVARPGTLRAELHVPQTDAKDVLLGQAVVIDTRNGVVAGRVERIDPAVVHDSVQVDVELTGPLAPGARPDLSVEGTIEIERLASVLYLPRPAAAQTGEGMQVFRLATDGETAARVPVRWGRASVTIIEVRQGLSEGDRVVLSDTSLWDRNDRIRLK
jgi:HlyD family secretion protein